MASVLAEVPQYEAEPAVQMRGKRGTKGLGAKREKPVRKDRLFTKKSATTYSPA